MIEGGGADAGGSGVHPPTSTFDEHQSPTYEREQTPSITPSAPPSNPHPSSHVNVSISNLGIFSFKISIENYELKF